MLFVKLQKLVFNECITCSHEIQDVQCLPLSSVNISETFFIIFFNRIANYEISFKHIFFLSCLISFLIYYSRHFDNNIIRKGNPSETHDVAAMFLKHLWCLSLSSYCLINCISSVPPSLGTIFSECFNASFVYCRSSFFTLRTSEIYLKKLLV